MTEDEQMIEAGELIKGARRYWKFSVPCMFLIRFKSRKKGFREWVVKLVGEILFSV